MESARAQEHAERASKLAAFSKRGKELYEMKLTENEHFESWKLSVEGWHRDVIANLNDAESAMFDAPISNALEAVGHSGALNRVHGDMRGRILVWLERINLILSR